MPFLCFGIPKRNKEKFAKLLSSRFFGSFLEDFWIHQTTEIVRKMNSAALGSPFCLGVLTNQAVGPEGWAPLLDPSWHPGSGATGIVSAKTQLKHLERLFRN